MSHGLLLTFEGGEGSGKSVQAKTLAAALEQAGHSVLLTREPGGTALAERIRDVLLHASEVPLAPETEALLFSAARSQHVREVIRPALAAGRIVISDRFYDSTSVYQGAGHGLDETLLGQVTAFAVGDTRPRRTYLLDLPVERALRRRSGATRPWDRFEAAEVAFHERLRDGYLRLAAAEPARILVVDADREIAAVAREIQADAESVIARRR